MHGSGRRASLSQGIIHGGTKYALSGKSLERASHQGVPSAVRCARGNGDVVYPPKLTSATSTIHDRSLSGSVAQFLALPCEVEWIKWLPEFLDSDRRVFQLSEPVIDTASVLNALAAQVQDSGRYDIRMR